MTKLKTLKDIEEECIKCYPHIKLAEILIKWIFKKLRQEAIKWYREYRTCGITCKSCQSKMRFIEQFFNLTEENLK